MLERTIEIDVLDASNTEGVGQVVFSPIAQGVLTGKYQDGAIPPGSRASDEKRGIWMKDTMTEDNFARVERLKPIAADLDCSLAQLAIAWTLKAEGVASAIVGASTPEQVTENAGAARIDLSQEVMAAIEEVLDNRPN